MTYFYRIGSVLISIHAPHEGERLMSLFWCMVLCNFNPRSPRGGATILTCKEILEDEISIHAPHEGERPQVSRKARRTK